MVNRNSIHKEIFDPIQVVEANLGTMESPMHEKLLKRDHVIRHEKERRQSLEGGKWKVVKWFGVRKTTTLYHGYGSTLLS